MWVHFIKYTKEDEKITVSNGNRKKKIRKESRRFLSSLQYKSGINVNFTNRNKNGTRSKQ